MSGRYDVIVVGIGGMGSATVCELAARGVNVLGLERFDIPHAQGSSHGITRMIRLGQYEGPAYVPMVRRAYERWESLEERTGRELLHITGGLDIGAPGTDIVGNAMATCEHHHIDHELLTAHEVNERFPGYDLPDDHRAVYQPTSGFLVPEQCIIAHVEAAHDAGAEIRAREPVTDVAIRPDGAVRVTSAKSTYEAEHVVVTAGPWMRELLPELADLAVPERQVLGWFQPDAPAAFDPAAFPVFVHESGEGHYYGFPRHDVPGFKLGKFHHFGETGDPAELDQDPRPEDEEHLRRYAERYFPSGAGPTMQLTTCMFTNTPDEHFILDTLADRPQITVGAGFSGHGFKFASAIGDVLADLALGEQPALDLELFRLSRF